MHKLFFWREMTERRAEGRKKMSTACSVAWLVTILRVQSLLKLVSLRVMREDRKNKPTIS